MFALLRSKCVWVFFYYELFASPTFSSYSLVRLGSARFGLCVFYIYLFFWALFGARIALPTNERTNETRNKTHNSQMRKNFVLLLFAISLNRFLFVQATWARSVSGSLKFTFDALSSFIHEFKNWVCQSYSTTNRFHFYSRASAKIAIFWTVSRISLF